MKNRVDEILIKVLICIACAGLTLYLLTEKQNELIELRLAIPVVAKEVQRLKEENIRLRYEIDRFENPVHLLEISLRPEYEHLKFPNAEDVITIHATHLK